jgi:hypothetical protein
MSDAVWNNGKTLTNSRRRLCPKLTVSERPRRTPTGDPKRAGGMTSSAALVVTSTEVLSICRVRPPAKEMRASASGGSSDCGSSVDVYDTHFSTSRIGEGERGAHQTYHFPLAECEVTRCALDYDLLVIE